MSEQVKSLAFFDLETTGLPNLDFNTKITELTIVACSSDHLLQTPADQLPRVLHKISLCFNPFHLIATDSTKITGLDNYMLEHEHRLDTNAGNLLKHFLQQLQQPVCMVAHNGDRFDFPLLQKELRKLQIILPDNLRCLDSLPVFRKIDTEEIIDDSDDDPKPIIVEKAVKKIDQRIQPKSIVELAADNVRESSQDFLSISDPNIIKEFLCETSDFQITNETTPAHRKIKNLPKKNQSNSVEASGSGGKVKNNISKTRARKQLFPWAGGKKYRLIDIYGRLHDGLLPDLSHYAEADTVNLLKCVLKTRESFLKYVDSDSKLFSTF